MRILVGASVFSGLTVGLGLTATHLLDPSRVVETAHKRQAAVMVPAVEKKIDTARESLAWTAAVVAQPKAWSKPRLEAKTARLLPHPPKDAAVRSRPLSVDAFNRRFVAPFSASALSARQRFASNLLAGPQAGALRSAFTPRLTDAAVAMNEARAFHLPGTAPAAAPAGNAVVALADPGALPHALDVEPTPAPKRAVAEDRAEAAAKPDPRSGGRMREAEQTERANEERAQPLRPGKSAKAPPMVAALAPAKPEAPAKPKSLWQALGFARPDNPGGSGAGKNIPWPGGSKKVAYYDISAQRVYMPNGESMEAHSGQGKLRDNPAFVHVKMRGSTPPSTYRLSMRETLFHGVQALRMTPTNGVNPHGRVGLLTHSYLRRVPGDSAGCVVFKDYQRFLKAYKRGEVDHIVVVPSMNKGRVMTAKVASLFSRSK